MRPARWCFDALPSEEPGVDRQPAGPEHRQRASQSLLLEGGHLEVRPFVRISEIATTATTAPATGVHNPAMRRSAASASDAEATMCNGGPLDSPGPACQRTTAPTTSRISSKAIPGQPPANVEYRRRNTYLDTIIRRGGATAPPRPGRGSDSLGSSDDSGGRSGTRQRYSSMIPLFTPMIAACVRSFASSFARMLLTRPLTVSSVMAS